MTAQKIEISHRTVVFTVFFLLGLKFLVEIQSILLILFISFIFVSSLNPIIDSMERFKVPRVLAILLSYFLIVGIVVSSVVGIAPLIVTQTIAFSQKIPDIIHQFQALGVGREAISSQIGQLWLVPLDVLKVSLGLFNNVLQFIVVGTITFYLLLERKKLDSHLLAIFGQEGQKKARRIVDLLESKLGSWVRGEVMLMTTVGLLSFIGFKILGVEFALPLAVLAGILEIVPNVGPIIASVIAVIGALSISPAIALAVLAWTFIVQQIEAQVLVPKIMQSTTGVHPVVSIVALLVGLKLAGTIGAILSIPVVLVLEVFIRELLISRGLSVSKS